MGTTGPAGQAGISAADRAATLRALADPDLDPADLTRPGHVFPLRYREGGVLNRPGHTEAAVDLLTLAGRTPVGVIGELVRPNGAMARRPDIDLFAAEHGLPVVTIAELVAHRRLTEQLVEQLVEQVGVARMPTHRGDFRAVGYRSMLTGIEHVALVTGDPSVGVPTVRVHSECLTGDAFGSLRCDCGEQLACGMEQIAASGNGVLVYLRGHEGRGIGLGPKLRAYALQDQGLDTVEANEQLGFPADARRYGIAAQILRQLGVMHLRLITNNPAKCAGLREAGLVVDERVLATTAPTRQNVSYLRTKQLKLGHVFEHEPTVPGRAASRAAR